MKVSTVYFSTVCFPSVYLLPVFFFLLSFCLLQSAELNAQVYGRGNFNFETNSSFPAVQNSTVQNFDFHDVSKTESLEIELLNLNSSKIESEIKNKVSVKKDSENKKDQEKDQAVAWYNSDFSLFVFNNIIAPLFFLFFAICIYKYKERQKRILERREYHFH